MGGFEGDVVCCGVEWRGSMRRDQLSNIGHFVKFIRSFITLDLIKTNYVKGNKKGFIKKVSNGTQNMFYNKR